MNNTETILSRPTTSNKPEREKDWFVIRTNSRCEKKVYEGLTRIGYTCYLPLQTTLRQWSDRKKKIVTPLIPSVVFVQDLDTNKEAIYSVQGVHSILKSNGKIGKVRNDEIEQLKIIVGEDIDFQIDHVESFLKGDQVEIIGGPLRGRFASAIQELGSFRVLIEIVALGLDYSVSLPKNYVRRI